MCSVDPITDVCREGPHVQIALDDLAGVGCTIRERSTLVARLIP